MRQITGSLSCSALCCPKKRGTPDSKPDDSGSSVGGETVAVLPSTGTGSSQANAGWLGAAAIGAAAAYIAGKALKGDGPEPEAAEE